MRRMDLIGLVSTLLLAGCTGSHVTHMESGLARIAAPTTITSSASRRVTPERSNAPPCDATSLSLTTKLLGESAGRGYEAWVLTNNGSTGCTVLGAVPTFTAINAAGTVLYTPHESQSGVDEGTPPPTDPDLITLDPRQSASLWVDYFACHPFAANPPLDARLRISFVGVSGVLTMSQWPSAPPCPKWNLDVGPLEPGILQLAPGFVPNGTGPILTIAPSPQVP